MCECLLEAYENTEQDVCRMRVHTIYQLTSDPTVPSGFASRTQAKTEVQFVWLGEDEI